MISPRRATRSGVALFMACAAIAVAVPAATAHIPPDSRTVDPSTSSAQPPTNYTRVMRLESPASLVSHPSLGGHDSSGNGYDWTNTGIAGGAAAGAGALVAAALVATRRSRRTALPEIPAAN